MVVKKIIKKIINFYKILSLKNRKIIIENNVSINKTRFSIYNRICKNSQVNDALFGCFSYIGWNCILNNIEVGSFTSIGPYTEIIYGTHPVNFVSTHPVFYSMRKQCGISFADKQLFQEFNYVGKSNKSAIIGSDVWIGYGVKIIEGVTINDGAVVLAGAVVTKDVEPYSIVGGVPAKHIKFRFDLETIEILKKSKWWERDMEWIRDNVSSFLSIESFIALIKEKTEHGATL